MPQLVQLQKQYPQDLAIVTLNVDFDDAAGSPNQELVAQVSSVLNEHAATCDNLICSTPMETVLSELELFGLPAAILYGRTGEVIARYDGEAAIVARVAQHLEANKGS